ncbi:MAG: chemotaxis protein CheD [Candidatus Scalindua sp. AMX11]|nr:MAG: chemotaxis protein CheD [Candidatus Scalindua sp.]NOG85751.1 chemotaxis protein CheD [Planctomycetota bacterium]RZV73198.1 MAG: chemotaxis protein CheD [Candidatus Scalindua sp. SCAELEC01]TDE64714.1 MAG: chemotaxis protein CheD [Candidatus Scalindua sp. AMX11]GJQ58725.1 MAG: chemotaxis protein CheD [Candidatus Scalindua sp.]
MITTINQEVVTVGVGDLKVAGIPKILKTSLGSCVGVVLYDNVIKVGGMLHLMLPKCKDRNGKLSKYADTGIPLLIDLMVKRANANKRNLTAKIFGGARMFNISSDMFDIGKSNILETASILDRLGIRISARRLGGTKGHQISLDTNTGIVQSRILGEPTVKY